MGHNFIHASARLVAVAFITYLCFGAFLFVFQRNYIYYPDHTTTTDCFELVESGTELVLSGSVRGYLVNAEAPDIIVFYHGNAGRACDRLFLAPHLTRHGYAVLFVEYSGYGERGIQPTKKRILTNVSDAVTFVAERGYRNTVVVGESLGDGPATYHTRLASISRVVLIAPYTSLADVASHHYPFFPVRILLRDNFAPAEWLADYKGNVVLIVAEHDEIIPVRLAERLRDKLSSATIRFELIAEENHNSLYTSPDFYRALSDALLP